MGVQTYSHHSMWWTHYLNEMCTDKHFKYCNIPMGKKTCKFWFHGDIKACFCSTLETRAWANLEFGCHSGPGGVSSVLSHKNPPANGSECECSRFSLIHFGKAVW